MCGTCFETWKDEMFDIRANCQIEYYARNLVADSKMDNGGQLHQVDQAVKDLGGLRRDASRHRKICRGHLDYVALVKNVAGLRLSEANGEGQWQIGHLA